jgi:hypothetical protein
VTVNNSTPSIGMVASPVAFAGGVDTATTTFTPANNTGSTTLTAVAPAGFSTPASLTSVTAAVNPAGVVCTPVAVGQHLETTASCTLQGGSPSAGMPVTITSSDPSKLLLSAISAGGTTCANAGSASITLSTTSPPGTAIVIIPNFCVYGQASSGSATYTVGVSGYATSIGTVTLGPAGFIIAGPGGIGVANFTPQTTTTTITVYPALLSSSPPTVQALAVGQSASVTVTSSNTAVGTVNPTTLSFSGGSSSNTTTFTSGSGGSTTLSVNTPMGFSTPSAAYTAVTANILQMSFGLTCDQGAIGQNLEAPCTVSIGQAAPAGGLPVTLTSNNPSQLLLSTTAAAAGSTSIMVTIPAGSTVSSTYYAQALSSSGTVIHAASASGFGSRTATMTLAPSGGVIAGPFGFGANFFNATVSGGPVAVTVYLGVLNTNAASCPAQAGPPCFTGTTQPLRGGLASLPVTLSSSITGVGTIASPAIITSGSDHVVTQFTPVSMGSTMVSVITPAGYTTSTNDTSLSAMVSP